METIDADSQEAQAEILNYMKSKCYEGETSTPGLGCPIYWDTLACWPATASGQHYIQRCPYYVFGFNEEANASKYCTREGKWESWTNYSGCYTAKESKIFVNVPVNATMDWGYVPFIKTLSHFGYGISAGSLIVAFIILASFKRLRCPRNMLHLHLFVSFIMKAFMGFLKTSLFEQGIGLRSDFAFRNGTTYFLDEQQGNWECKMLTTLWQYFIMANYSWVMMEGLYIHNLIMWALSADSSSILAYIMLGWGLPLIYVPAWALGRAYFDNDLCWTVNSVRGVFYIIHIPTSLSMLINFGLFVNIVRLLTSKVRTSIVAETQRYWRLAKSTMVLVALFGIPYCVFLGLYFGEDQVQVAWLLSNQLFASFQGFFVGLLYCYFNGEVQEELKKVWLTLTYYDKRNDSTFTSASCASWSSSHSTQKGKCNIHYFRHILRRCLRLRTQPESRASKRTETVDCIVCETCPVFHDDIKRQEMQSERNVDDEPGVEMKLMAENYQNS